MHPKFNTKLSFESDGALEVCGPTNFQAGEKRFRLLRVEIDQGGTSVVQDFQDVVVRSGAAMWEAVVEAARIELAPGAARAHGKGRVVHDDGTSEIVRWDAKITLAEPVGKAA